MSPSAESDAGRVDWPKAIQMILDQNAWSLHPVIQQALRDLLEADARCICGDTYGPEDCPVHEDDEIEGCDCADWCSMGPTCPGGYFAGLPGAACTRVFPPEVTAP